MLITSQPRCSRLAAWTTAVLRGRAAIDDALDALSGPDGPVTVSGLSSTSEAGSLTEAFGYLRSLEVTGLAFAPALAGNVLGLPGPPEFNARAVASGGAAIAVDGRPIAFLPLEAPSWQVTTVGRFGLLPTETVAEAERQLLEELNRVLDELTRLDVARWRDEAHDLLAGWHGDQAPTCPPGLTDRANQLIHRCEHMTQTLALALADDGAAVSTSEAVHRHQALIDLQRAAVVAGATAWNAGLVPTSRVA